MDSIDKVINEKSFEPLLQKVEEIKSELGKVIIGQEQMIELLIVAILSNGHVLLEGVAGIAKTLTAKLLSKVINTDFSRIQFTPDLMPSDVTGTTIFNTAASKFEFNRGPVFSNLVLIDEINRAPAKTQSALFEVMEERQVSVDGVTYPMSAPFIIIATQNPLEHEGTYRLPEAQLDRFLFKIVIEYPTPDEEYKILQNADLRKSNKETEHVKSIISAAEIIGYQKEIHQVQIEEKLLRYISDIVNASRNNPSLYLGASPRASLNILYAAKAFAAVQGRNFVIPEDIKFVTPPILIHRIYTTPEKEMEGVTELHVVQELINSIEVPR